MPAIPFPSEIVFNSASCIYSVQAHFAYTTINLLVNLRSPRDVFVLLFVPSFVCSIVRLASVRFWPAFMMTVHINALYNESVHGMEEHAT